MWLLDGYTAMFTFLQTMTVPAAILMIYGILQWRRGLSLPDERMRRRGKLLTIFGLAALFIFGGASAILWALLDHIGKA